MKLDSIYKKCKKTDKMFCLIFDLPVDGAITFEWRWIGMEDDKIYCYQKSISMLEIERARFPEIIIENIADESNW